MSVYSYNTSVTSSYTATAAENSKIMAMGTQYRLYCSTDAWFRITTPGGPAAAVGGSDSHPISAGNAVLVSALGTKTKVSVVRNTADGNATLSELLAVEPGI